jgi:hypothetical protein
MWKRVEARLADRSVKTYGAMTIIRPDVTTSGEDLGLSLEDGKEILRGIQSRPILEDQGLSTESKIAVLADGGDGLRALSIARSHRLRGQFSTGFTSACGCVTLNKSQASIQWNGQWHAVGA